MDKSRYGVHRTHCCVKHGCKYNDKDCPVVSGEIKQDYLCESCGYDGINSIDDLLDLLINYKQRIIEALENEKLHYDELQRNVWAEAYEEWERHVKISEIKIELLESLLKIEERKIIKFDVIEIIKIIDKEIEFAREVNSQMALGMLRIKELIIKTDNEKEAEANKNY